MPSIKWPWPFSYFQRHFLTLYFYEASPNEDYPLPQRKLNRMIEYRWSQRQKAIEDLLEGIHSSNTLYYELVPVKKLGRWKFNSRDELNRYLLLRAAEWQTWPQFLSIGIGPWLLLWVSPWVLILFVFIIDIIWYLACLSYVNERWLRAGIYIHALGWVTSPGMGIWFWVHSNRFLAIIAMAWPFVIPIVFTVLKLPLSRWIPRPLGEIQVKIFNQMLRRGDARLPPDIGRVSPELSKIN